jgi:hypothetical protein
MTSAPAPRKAGLNSGWILVTVLLGLCVLGTWLTARNYRQQVFSSTTAVVLENQWPESRISATFSAAEARHLRAGQPAKITLGSDKTVIPGCVLSVGSGSGERPIIIAVTGEMPNAGQPLGKSDAPVARRYLPSGAACSVSVDSSIPVDAVAAPSPAR